MTRLLLRFLNSPALFLIVVAGVAVQSSLFASYPFMYLQPDITLLAVIWCALKRRFFEGGTLTLLAAYVAELHSGAPRGSYLVAYMACYLLIRFLSRYVMIPKLPSLIILTLFVSVFWKLSILSILALLDQAGNQWRHTLVLLLPGAVMEGIAGMWVYRWFERFDWVTFKDPRARQALEDELQLEEEGL